MKKSDTLRNIGDFLDVLWSRKRAKAPRSIKFLLLWITENCNLKCAMCGDRWRASTAEGKSTLSKEQWFSVIDSAKKLDTLVISITGGEALLHPDIFEILRHIKDCGMAAHLCSNGMALNDETVAKLRESGVHSFGISLDSDVPEIHNSLRGLPCFDQAVAGIEILRKALPRAKIGINFLISKPTFRRMKNIVDLGGELGVNQINFQPIHTNLQHKNKPLSSFQEFLFEPGDIDELERELKDLRAHARKRGMRISSGPFIEGIPLLYRRDTPFHACYAGYITCSVSPWGEVSPCADIDNRQTIHDATLEEIWRSPDFQSLRKRVRECTRQCWDTTNAELALRCTPAGFFHTLGDSVRDLLLYSRREK
jgi:MoaA/NifB/PqqE/SkfB family radical SAM enzyme